MRNDTVLTQPASAAKAWWTVSLLIFRSRLSVILKRIEQETWSRDINSPLNMRPSLALRFSMEINRQLNFEVMAPHSRRGTP